MVLPAKIYGDKKLVFSRDGSVLFYNLEYQETYRAKSVGAFTESLYKFVLPSGVLELKRDVRILDLCFGMGANSAVTFEFRRNFPYKTHIVTVEKDASLLPLIREMRILIPVNGYDIARSCLKNGFCGNCSLEFYAMEAQELVGKLSGVFDAIYFDPFSIKKNPEMWNVAMFSSLRGLLAKGGKLTTYAGGKAAREAMRCAGLRVYKAPACLGAFMESTVADLI